MAYNLSARLPPPPKYITLLDPGAYQGEKGGRKKNAAPFNSKTPRNTQAGVKLWTQAIYDQSLPRYIPNCSSMLSKRPRFPYEAFSAEDLEEIMCKCGILSPCKCPTGQERQEDVICQGKVRRRIFKGPTPRSVLGDEGLSTPSRKDHGFNISTNGSQHRLREENKEKCPPFYDTRVNESTAFYQGCKWSRRTSIRAQKHLEVKPGPADYFFEREPTKDEICIEKNRAFKRKTSTLLRFMEMIRQKNILEDRPGPTTYNPMLPKGTDLQYTGSKAKRFPTSKNDVRPGPADHWLRRDFDPIKFDISCHANLPQPPCFGTKTKRFGTQHEKGPSPATYDVNFRVCNFINCHNPPFGTSAKRFKEEIFKESDEEEIGEPLLQKENEEKTGKPCVPLTWEFKSKTIRMKPLVKKSDQPSPADLPQSRTKVERSPQLQNAAPFFSSEGRFRPWYSWIPVHAAFQTPGPATYCLEKPTCLPAFIRGPLYRAKRFPNIIDKAPSPNAYKINDGIETILATHNKRLKNNIENRYKYHWEPTKPKKVLSFEEREVLLFNKYISLLDTEEVPKKALEVVKHVPVSPKQKMLRSFLYAYPLPKYL